MLEGGLGMAMSFSETKGKEGSGYTLGEDIRGSPGLVRGKWLEYQSASQSASLSYVRR